MTEHEHYEQWTPCQMYGHLFEVDESNLNRHVCRDCGESYEDEDAVVAEHNEWPECPHPNPCPRKDMNGRCDPWPRKVSVCPIYKL